MKPEIKAQWVAALRSGAYKQVRKALHTDQGYCCLGVLCELYNQDTNHVWHEDPCSGKYELHLNASELPAEVQRWAGLDGLKAQDLGPCGSDPVVCAHPNQDYSTCLSYLNDDCKLSFGQIADLIEEQL